MISMHSNTPSPDHWSSTPFFRGAWAKRRFLKILQEWQLRWYLSILRCILFACEIRSGEIKGTYGHNLVHMGILWVFNIITHTSAIIRGNLKKRDVCVYDGLSLGRFFQWTLSPHPTLACRPETTHTFLRIHCLCHMSLSTGWIQ